MSAALALYLRTSHLIAPDHAVELCKTLIEYAKAVAELQRRRIELLEEKLDAWSR